MPQNDFLPIAIAGGAPVTDQASYVASTPANGLGAGIVPKEKYNKMVRQGSVMAAALGMFMNSKGEDALDDGDVPTLASNMAAALAQAGLQVSDFTGTHQHLAATGFQDLPGGLILQWVAGVVVSGPSSTPFSWYKPFPGAVFGAVVGTNGSFLSTGMVGVITLDVNGGRLDSEAGSDTPTCFVIGIGH